MHLVCASYTEVRQFLTSAANHEIAKTEVSCIPYGINPKTLGGDFIQEGADNIYLNTETIDGKNTMHSIARAVFQVVQDHTPTSEISSTMIKRGQDRSLSMTEETTSLMTCLPYRKPKERHGRLGCCSACCPDGQSNCQSLPIKSSKSCHSGLVFINFFGSINRIV
jgi:hypothetical protein